MMRGRMLHAPMSQPPRPTREKRNATWLRAVPTRRSDAMALRTAAHRFHEVTGHPSERQEVRHSHFREGADNLVDIAAGAEVAASPLHHDGAHVAGLRP